MSRFEMRNRFVEGLVWLNPRLLIDLFPQRTNFLRTPLLLFSLARLLLQATVAALFLAFESIMQVRQHQLLGQVLPLTITITALKRWLLVRDRRYGIVHHWGLEKVHGVLQCLILFHHFSGDFFSLIKGTQQVVLSGFLRNGKRGCVKILHTSVRWS